MTTEPTIRKRWMVVFNLNVDGLYHEMISDFINQVKENFPEELFSDFFGAKTLVLYIPTRTKETGIEITEVLLDVHGYDKWDVELDKYNLNAKDVLDRIRKILDGNEE